LYFFRDEVRFISKGEGIRLFYVGAIYLLYAFDLIVNLSPTMKQIDFVVYEAVVVIEGPGDSIERAHRRFRAKDIEREVHRVKFGLFDLPKDLQEVQREAPDFGVYEC
jgi:hypothetical protein